MPTSRTWLSPLFCVALLALLATLPFAYNRADPDLWHRLAVGEIVFQTGAVARTDSFAYTPKKELWIDHEWGSGVVFYAVREWFGDNGLVALKFLMITAVTMILLATAANWTPFAIVPAFAVIWGLLPYYTSVIRCQVFTFLFFALWHWTLRAARNDRPRLLILLPVTMLFWANLHGGFLAGIGLLVMFAAGEWFNGRRPWFVLAALVAALLVSLANPYGAAMWRYLIAAVSMARPGIEEWAPNNLGGTGIRAYLILAALVAVARLREKGLRLLTADWTQTIIIGVTIFLALQHRKHNPLFLLASAPAVLAGFRGLVSQTRASLLTRVSPRAVNLLRASALSTIYLFLLLVVIATARGNRYALQVSEPLYPVRAVAFIRQSGLSGNLLVPFNWGSYALWELRGRCRVSIDGRYEEVYTDDTFLALAAFAHHSPGWERALNAYANEIILLPQSSPVLSAVKATGAWRVAYEDETAVVLRKRDNS